MDLLLHVLLFVATLHPTDYNSISRGKTASNHNKDGIKNRRERRRSKGNTSGGASYVTLPLYALVTQMGTTMKPTIFNEKVAKALRNWHYNAKKHIKQNNRLTDGSVPPSPSRPGIPQHGMSPVHLLRHYRSSEIDSVHTTSRNSHFDNEYSENEGSFSPSHSCHHDDAPPRSHHGRNRDLEVQPETEGQAMSSIPLDHHSHHEIDIPSAGFRGARI
ncbi:MLO-like protein 6 [Camellia lanceoleosa]|uniref:MLO-like protein 6 n=1 Tax=Camellia lanceoleosa TaxID=1840588 RepID=A0ACC0HMV6_9ERIC|nr:MLO-like protein 6 [Camellia lanceoleosa]